MARKMLSNDVIPELGPSHFSRQMETLALQVYAPIGASSAEPSWHGFPDSDSITSRAAGKGNLKDDLGPCAHYVCNICIQEYLSLVPIPLVSTVPYSGNLPYKICHAEVMCTLPVTHLNSEH